MTAAGKPSSCVCHSYSHLLHTIAADSRVLITLLLLLLLLLLNLLLCRHCGHMARRGRRYGSANIMHARCQYMLFCAARVSAGR
jgi:hypothetical protein